MRGSHNFVDEVPVLVCCILSTTLLWRWRRLSPKRR